MIAQLYTKYSFLLKDGSLEEGDREFFRRVTTDMDDALILEFKVRDEEDEETLKETVASALCQIKEKRYAVQLIARGIPSGRIRCYGFAFEGKKVLIG